MLWPSVATVGGGDAHSLELSQRPLGTAALRTVSDILFLSTGDTLVTTTPIHGLVGRTCGLNATVIAGAGIVRTVSPRSNGVNMEIHRSRGRTGVTTPAVAPGAGKGSPGRARPLRRAASLPQRVSGVAD